jgi:hypothetical protein
VGKILVFVNLLISLVVGGLIIIVFVARANWREGYEKYKKEYQVVAAESDSREERLRATEASMAVMKGKLEKERDQAKDDSQKKGEKIAELEKALSESDRRYQKDYVPPLKVADTHVDMANNAAQDSDKRVKEYQTRITTLQQDNVDLRAEAVSARIDARSQKARAEDMEAKMQEMAKRIVKLEEQRGSGTGTTSPGSRVLAKNPPPENVEGIIMRTDPGSGLVVISIGSDSGLQRGHTLEVFRLNPNKYLGTIQIMDVRPHEAVGKPTMKMLGPIQQGDRVAAKILGS